MFNHYENIICLGDLNYDLLKKDKYQPLTNICDNFGLDCIVKNPTCFTKNQVPTLIDVIITNLKTLLCNTINFNCGLSDCQSMTATSLKESCNPIEKKKATFHSYTNPGPKSGTKFCQQNIAVKHACIQLKFGLNVDYRLFFEMHISIFLHLPYFYYMEYRTMSWNTDPGPAFSVLTMSRNS